jgi:hypothetical protein
MVFETGPLGGRAAARGDQRAMGHSDLKSRRQERRSRSRAPSSAAPTRSQCRSAPNFSPAYSPRCCLSLGEDPVSAPASAQNPAFGTCAGVRSGRKDDIRVAARSKWVFLHRRRSWAKILDFWAVSGLRTFAPDFCASECSRCCRQYLKPGWALLSLKRNLTNPVCRYAW